MSEKRGIGEEFKKLYAYDKKPKSREETFEDVKKKDGLVSERKAQIVSTIKELIASEGMENPAKELTIEVLQSWLNKHPDKFFGLKDSSNILGTYFYGGMKNLKFSLGLIKE
jgi:hypothetical protein